MRLDLGAVKRTVLVLLFLALLQLVVSSQSKRVLWVNLTGSESMGVYRAVRFDGHVRRGDMVIIAVPPEFERYLFGRRWLPKGWSLIKHVGAVPGDVYCVTDSFLFINGTRVGPVYTEDRHGLPLPRIEGCRAVPSGKFLPVATRIRRSFDGRYMGPLDITAIEGVVKPVFVFD